MNKRLIIISGMHRSGTSALAKAFVDLGFDAGKNLIPPDNDNPCGYWEDRDIYNLNDAILSKLFLSWDRIENFENRRINHFTDEINSLFKAQALRLINDKLSDSDQVVIKDPRFSILMPFWNNILKKLNAQIDVFHIHRNPISVAQSLEKRNGLSRHNGMLLWYFYNLTLFSEVQFPVKIISYHQLLSNPEKIFKIISETRGVSTATKPFADYSSSIKPELDHHKIAEDKPDTHIFPFPEISTLWNLLSAKSSNNCAGISKNEIAPCRIKNLRNVLLPPTEQKFVSTIVFPASESHHKLKTFQTSGISGKNDLVFDMSAESIICSDFEIYLFDKPCKVKLYKTTIELESGVMTIKPDKGNHTICRDNQYFFDENQPYLHFSLSKISAVKTIKLSVEIDVLQADDLELIVSTHRINRQLDKKNLDQKTATNQSLVADNTVLKNKINEFEVLAKEHQSEIIMLEKKSLWLYNKLTKTKNSLSWKITFPLRWIQHLVIKVIGTVHILIKDIGASYRLLRREGLSVFVYRLQWYIRGKRLKENIEALKHQYDVAGRQAKAKFLPDCVSIFPKVAEPLVTIVIPSFNKLHYTCQCIASINRHTKANNFEVIVIDDHSTEDLKILHTHVKGAQIIRNDQNIGFLKSCNKAAKHARGKYICFLNNDTEMQAGWLDHLVNSMEEQQDIGLAGSKLIYPDGRLQEAGGMVWNDATAWNYGKFDDPDKPEYNYLKDVDYISGACILVRKSVWEKLDGFDEQFTPAYYEDTDLAYGVRKLGFRVVYQPLSVVVHHEGISNGVDETGGIKKFQESNRAKFMSKWKHELSVESSPNGNNVFFHRDRSLGKKHLLVIDHYVPHFDQDAGSRSTFSYLKLFLKMGYKIHFISDNFFKHEPYTTILQQLGIEVIYGNYHQKHIREWFSDYGHYFDFVIAHRAHIAPKYLDLLKKYCQAKIAYVGHDLQYMGSWRKFELTQQKSFKKESVRFKKTETKIFNTVDIIFPFSTVEAPLIKKLAPEKIVKPIPVYFYENATREVPAFEMRQDILFVGFFGHPPNPDAILWFIKEVFPILKKHLPDVRINIVGSKPTAEVLALANDSITVTGYVSDEKLLEYYHKSKVAILPLRFGAGVKGKLLESLYHQIPAVITSVAAEGVPEIEHYSMIADDAVEFAKKIHQLYTDKESWQYYSTKGRELINKYYTEEAARKIMEEVFSEK